MEASIPILGLSVVNLILLLGVVRRVNQLAGQPRSGRPVATAPASSAAVVPGDKLGDFVATTTDGEPITANALAGRTLVAFLTVHCRLCEELTPRLRACAQAFPGGRGQVLVVIVVPRREHPGLGHDLAGVARVVTEPAGGAVSTAFGVHAYPGFFLLHDRVVLAVGAKPEALPGVAAGTAAAQA
jgi:hypothetical protein